MAEKNLRQLDAFVEKGVNSAAALAKLQLEYALSVVEQAGQQKDPALVAAVLQAIALNQSVKS